MKIKADCPAKKSTDKILSTLKAGDVFSVEVDEYYIRSYYMVTLERNAIFLGGPESHRCYVGKLCQLDSFTYYKDVRIHPNATLVIEA